MKVRIKKLVPEAVIPAYAHDTDAGMDLVAVSKEHDEYGNVVYGTGIAMEIPDGYMGLIFPRSSNSKKNVFLTNSVGVVDSGYRGQIMAKFKPMEYAMVRDYEIGDRIGQIVIMPYPKIEFEEVEDLSKTDRGEGGYGSSGR